MASSPDAAQLTERHRLLQLRLGVSGARRMIAAWPLIDPADIDRTFERWVRVVIPLTSAQREASAQLARRYYESFRNREVPDAPRFTPPPPPPLDTDAFTGALVITGPASLKRNAERGMDLVRASGLARTETTRAAMRYSLDGGRSVITGSVSRDPHALGWARVASGRACAFCSMLASRGPVYSETTVGFEAHRGCVIPDTEVTGPSAEVAYRRWYEGELVVIGISGDRELSVTPNHPVLTHRGWVPAGRLSEGDYVVRRTGSDLADLVVPHEDDVPAPIEDVWRAAAMRGLRSVPVAPEDFHGDGIGSEGQVDVVAPDGLFPYGLDTPGLQQLTQSIRGWADSADPTPFPPEGHLASELLGLGLAPDRCVCGGGAGLPLLGGEAGLVDETGGAHATALHTQLLEPAGDYGTTYAQPFGDAVLGLATEVRVADRLIGEWAPRLAAAPRPRFDPPTDECDSQGLLVHAQLGRDLLERLAGGVELCGIGHLRRVEYSGHVFNLRTAEGWFDANSLVVSNCGCSAEPVFRSDTAWPPGSRDYQQMWSESGAQGPDALNTFRRHLAAVRSPA